MIRITKGSAPGGHARRENDARPTLETAAEEHRAELAARKRHRLAIDDGLYAHEEIKAALHEAQQGKCAYCERRIECSVDHYRPVREAMTASRKKLRPGYWWLAYSWDNLLLACDPCNTRCKGTHFPLRDESNRARKPGDDLSAEMPLLLNPAVTDPEDHITFRGPTAVAVDGSDIGETTIRLLKLNKTGDRERDKLFQSRAERLGEFLQLSTLCDSMIRARDRLLNRGEMLSAAECDNEASRLLRKLSRAGEPDMQYSAMIRAALKTLSATGAEIPST